MEYDNKNKWIDREGYWITDYDAYHFERLEGPDTELLPEDFLPSARLIRPKTQLFKRPDAASLRPALLFLITSLIVSYLTWLPNLQWSRSLAVSGKAVFESHQYWRLLTALWVHADLGHFLSNAWLLGIFGYFLRDVAGPLAFPVLSLVVGVLANLMTVAFYPPTLQLVGASGMVYGMIGMWLAVFWQEAPYPIPEKLLRCIGFCLLMLVPSTYRPEVSYLAHSFGFALGLLLGILGNKLWFYKKP